MHTKRSTPYRRAMALAALLLAGCGGQGLGRQPAAHMATMPSSTPPSTATATAPPQPEPAAATADTTPTTAPPTVTTVPEPQPAPTPAPRRAPRAAVTVPTLPEPATVDGLPRQLRRIGGCESTWDPDGPLLWTQPNLQGSTASGAFQVLDSTWRGWAVTYGAGTDATSYSRAKDAPPTTQVTVVIRAHAAEGTRPWVSSVACWG